ncbi:hypothetical protein C8J56DRAFT_1172614 [Mycena floridula]|nr:hypothetical protein C8J56DRAFT_1172614 [Mycena floridula]
MPFKLTRFRRSKKVPETSHLAGPIAEELNVNHGGAQMGALIQSLHGARLDNINGPVFSNNQLTTVHHHHQAPDNKDYTEIKVGDIVLKKELKSGSTHHELQSDGTLSDVGQIRVYDGYIYDHSNRPMLITRPRSPFFQLIIAL